jgi:hypothetical protein
MYTSVEHNMAPLSLVKFKRGLAYITTLRQYNMTGYKYRYSKLSTLMQLG